MTISPPTIHTIIEHQLISILFQPIIETSEEQIWGYEALCRGPSNSLLHSPFHLFRAAQQAGVMAQLELMCITRALESYSELSLKGKLCLNISPHSFIKLRLQKSFGSLLTRYGLRTNDIVFEITEQDQGTNGADLIEAIKAFQTQGYFFAIDDLGAGYSSLIRWSTFAPDFVKIDRHFMQSLDTDRIKREFVRSIIEIARSVGSKVICEGVETEGEYHQVVRLGTDFVQGYYIAHPQSQPISVYQPTHLPRVRTGGDSIARQLVYAAAAVDLETNVLEVAQHFHSNPSINSIAVVDGDKPVGLVLRTRLLGALARPYARELNRHKSIFSHIDSSPLCVESHLQLEQVSRLVTNRARFYAEDDFIIVENGKFLGLGQVIDLLRQITESQVRTARHANPLTLLPGNIPIHDCIDRILAEGKQCVVCYFDLDHFKPFNDIYGYVKGDEALLFFAELLKTHGKHQGDFIGHVGGDDFVGVYLHDNWKDCIGELMAIFSSRISQLYRKEHVIEGGFRAKDRYGEHRFHPMLSLSIAALKVNPSTMINASELSAQMSQVKHMAKAVAGSCLVYKNASDIKVYSSESLLARRGMAPNAELKPAMHG